jgi:hypothetical protein
MVQESPVCAWGETHEHIHIAVGTEVVPQNQAKEGKLGDLPSVAELRDALPVDWNVEVHVLGLLPVL